MSAFQINLNPLKEPLGFIKILEWVSATSDADPGRLGAGGALRGGGDRAPRPRGGDGGRRRRGAGARGLSRPPFGAEAWERLAFLSSSTASRKGRPDFLLRSNRNRAPGGRRPPRAADLRWLFAGRVKNSVWVRDAERGPCPTRIPLLGPFNTLPAEDIEIVFSYF